MRSYSVNAHIFKYNDKYYFFDSAKIRVIMLNPDIGEFLIRCKAMSFKEMLDRNYCTQKQLRVLCNQVQPLLKAEFISFNEFDTEKNFIIDFNNINYIWEMLIYINDSFDEVKKLENRFSEIVEFLSKYSYGSKVYHFALAGNDFSAVNYALENLNKYFEPVGKKVFFAVQCKEDQQFCIPGKKVFNLHEASGFEHDETERSLYCIEKYLAFWRYGEQSHEFEPNDLDITEESGKCLRQAFKENILKYSEIARLLRQVRKSRKRFFNCSGGINSLVLDFETGNLRACPHSLKCIGNLKDGLDYNERQKYFRNSVLSVPECTDCWARYLCGKHCLNIARQECTQFKKILESIIALYYDLMMEEPEIFKILDQSVEVSRHKCFYSPISEYCILGKPRFGGNP